MATGTVQSTSLPPAPPMPGESKERELLIRRQLGRTSLYVRMVDLASSVVVWLIGVLLFLIAAALYDHFIGLGVFGRCAALAALAGGSLWYLAMHVGPLVVRAINPAFAARTIEEATPSLKNSLINFLLLKHDRGGLKEIVYQAVERQAAADIAAVPVEATIDRTRLIHAGYVLCAVMAIFAAYKILSPKDPFQTVARVLAPWADIARPSRVQISDVQPGSTQVYHGQSVAISATVRGVREGDVVKVLYSTADGQTIDMPLEMKRSAGDQYECTLPPGGSNASLAASGVQQDTTYRLVAGDAESFPYRLTVISSPTIIIERLEYQYPAYTKKAASESLDSGDIKALEGTKVTVHAIANQPIKSAWIEFDPSADAPAEVMTLSAEGERARGTMTLLLKPGGQQSWHTTYQLRFYNEQGQRSQQPILHKIEVIRDLPPEVQILRPDRLRVEVPEDGEQVIEVRALDPDYGLAAMRIEGTVAGKPPVRVDLLDGMAGQPPQITVPYAFRPREHKLSAGDELKYAAVAEDNRTNSQSGQPDPNSTRTKEYTLAVVAPQKRDQGQGGQNQPAGGGDQNNQQQPDKAQRQPPNKQQQPAEQKQNPMKDAGGKGNEQQGGKQGDDQKNQQQSQQEGGQSKQEGAQQQGKQQPGEQQQDNQQQSGQQQSGQQQNGQQPSGQQPSGQADGQQNQQQGGSQQSGQSGGKSGGAGQQSNPSGGESGKGESGGGGQSQPNESSGASKPDGQQTGQQGNSRGEASSQQRGQDQGKADDGRAIEEVWKDLQKDGQAPQQNGDQASSGQSKQGGEAGQTQPGQQQGGQPQAGGKSSAQNQNTPNSGTPEASDQQSGQKGEAQRSTGKAGKAHDRVDDEQQGQNPSEQSSSGAKGGESHGGSKTDKGEKSPPGKGQERDAGAGKTGDEGAGQASEDKSGSGDGSYKNRDHNKEQKSDSDKAEKGEPSPANSSHRQSDSKGGSSGNDSGGGKQGAGQAAGQQGNDSAGSQSAGDQGTGKADETGGGETGSKAGQQQQAGGKTGQTGNEKGEGSGSREGKQTPGAATKAPERAEGKTAKGQKKSDSRAHAAGGGSGSEPVGGADDEQPRFQNKTEAGEEQEADAANLEYARKATDMVLKRLKEEEHNPDPDLLNKLGWTREDLAEFLRRWEALKNTADQSQAGQRELDESLKSLGLRDPANRRRTGGKASDNQRDLRDAGNRSSPPPQYRDLFDAFRKGAARSSP